MRDNDARDADERQKEGRSNGGQRSKIVGVSASEPINVGNPLVVSPNVGTPRLVWYGGGILGWVYVLGGLVGVVSLRGPWWVFGGVQVCGWLLGLGVGWALWMAAVVVWLL